MNGFSSSWMQLVETIGPGQAWGSGGRHGVQERRDKVVRPTSRQQVDAMGLGLLLPALLPALCPPASEGFRPCRVAAGVLLAAAVAAAAIAHQSAAWGPGAVAAHLHSRQCIRLPHSMTNWQLVVHDATVTPSNCMASPSCGPGHCRRASTVHKLSPHRAAQGRPHCICSREPTRQGPGSARCCQALTDQTVLPAQLLSATRPLQEILGTMMCCCRPWSHRTRSRRRMPADHKLFDLVDFLNAPANVLPSASLADSPHHAHARGQRACSTECHRRSHNQTVHNGKVTTCGGPESWQSDCCYVIGRDQLKPVKRQNHPKGHSHMLSLGCGRAWSGVRQCLMAGNAVG